MARGFLRSLAERLAYPFVELARRLGTATRTLGEVLARAGTSIEADAIRRIEHTLDQAAMRTERVLGVPDDVIVDPDIMAEAVTRQRRRFAWVTRWIGIDPMSGQRITRYLTISTDDLLTSAEALKRAQDEVISEYKFSERGIISGEVVRVTKAGPAGVL